MSIKLNLILEFSIVAIFLSVGYLLNFEEIRNVFQSDTGTIVMDIGILWGIASFFRPSSWRHAIPSLSIAIGLFLYGYWLTEYEIYGMFTLFVTMGFYFVGVIGVFIVLRLFANNFKS